MVLRAASCITLRRLFLVRYFIAFCGVSLLLGCNQEQQGPVPFEKSVRQKIPSINAQQSWKTNKNGIREISFDDIVFEMNEGTAFSQDLLPDRVVSLKGQRIRIRGYILPSFQQTGLTQFVLVRDNMECCFGPGAALYDCIVVKMAPGKTAEFSIRPVAVTGIFGIKELKGPDGNHLAVYALIGDSVQ
jgi:hypothetical protein